MEQVEIKSKPKPIVTRTGAIYLKVYESFKRSGIPFKTVTCGSQREIHLPNGMVQVFYTNGNKVNMKGVHLVRMVRNEVQKRIDEGLYVVKSDPDTFAVDYNLASVYSMWNKVGILRCLNEFDGEMIGVDIKSCYWNTIHNIGAIGDEVYEKGKRKDKQGKFDKELDKEWKVARNAAIGSLSKRITVNHYDHKGCHLNDMVEVTISPLTAVRLDILAHVYKLSVAIAKALGDKFCYFATDCFYVTQDGVSEVLALLKECLYAGEVKSERVLYLRKKSDTIYYMGWRRGQAHNGGDCINHFSIHTQIQNQPDYVLKDGIGMLRSEAEIAEE